MGRRQLFFSSFQQALIHGRDHARSPFGTPRAAVATLVFLTLWLSATPGAATDRYRIERSSSVARFDIRHLTGQVSGSFSNLTGIIEIDSDSEARCRVETTIYVASLATDDMRRTTRLTREDFFDTARFPTILFRSETWRRTDADTYEVTGPLTIKGITQRITLQVQQQAANDRRASTARWLATTRLNRKDFNVSGGPPGVIGDKVTISLDIRATQELPPVSIGLTNLVSPDEPGDRLVIHGTIFEADGKTPVTNAVLQVYHTDASGVYSREVKNAEGERNPRLKASLKTDDYGRYELHTIMPGRYPGGKTPAHVHLLVSAPGYNDKNATFSFSGDPALTPDDYEKHGRDGSFSSVRPAERDAAGILRCQRDVRLLKQGKP